MLQLSENEPLCNHLSGAKKLVLVLATSSLVTETNKKDHKALQRLPCIYYLIWFKIKKVQALIDSGSDINAMILAYVSRLDLRVHRTNVRA